MRLRLVYFALAFLAASSVLSDESSYKMKKFLINELELLKLSLAIQSNDIVVAKQLIAAGTNLNRIFEIPKDIDIDQFEYHNRSHSLIDRAVDGFIGLIEPLPSKPQNNKTAQSFTRTSTLLNVYIAIDDIEAQTLALDLGANPLITPNWSSDAFYVAIFFRKPAALDILLQKYSFELLPLDRQKSLIASLPQVNTLGNSITGYEHTLDPRFLEVATKNKIDLSRPIEPLSFTGGKPKNLLQVSLFDQFDSGKDLGTAIWLVEHGFNRTVEGSESISEMLDHLERKKSLSKRSLTQIAQLHELISKIKK